MNYVDVVIIDDNPVLIEQAKMIINNMDRVFFGGMNFDLRPHGINPVNEERRIDNGKILNELSSINPGVALVDLCLLSDKDLCGIDVSLLIKNRYPDCSAVLVSSYLEYISNLNIFRCRIDRSKLTYVEDLKKTLEDATITYLNSINYRMKQFVDKVNNGIPFMWAMTIGPHRKGVKLQERVPIPNLYHNSVLVQTIEIGICGTDRHSLGQISEPPYEIIDFHEAFGKVTWTGESVTNVQPGDFVIPIVRRCETWEAPPPDCPIEKDQFLFYPCSNNATQDCFHHADQCPSSEYKQKDKKGRRIGYKSRGTGKCHGFGSQYFHDTEDWLIKITPPMDPDLREKMYKRYILTEPLSIVWKAHREIVDHYKINDYHDEVLIIGIGPIGLLMLVVMKALHPGLKYTVVDLAAVDNRRVKLVRKYYSDVDFWRAESEDAPPDIIRSLKYHIVIEATGQPEKIFQYVTQNRMLAPNGIIMLIGVTEETTAISLNAQAFTQFVKGGNILLGSINSSRTDFENSIFFMEKVLGKSDSLLDHIATRWKIGQSLKNDIVEKLGNIPPKNRNEIKVVLEAPDPK